MTDKKHTPSYTAEFRARGVPSRSDAVNAGFRPTLSQTDWNPQYKKVVTIRR